MQDFAHSSYHRPHDPKVLVPSGSVKPYPVRDDGSWDLSEEEPMVARTSLRRQRTVLTLATIAFSIGALMIILSSPYSNEFLAPGPLHSSHAQLLAGKGADRCASCHSGSTSSAFGWVAHAFSGASNKMTQSHLCLECHKSTLNEAYALNPHNVAPGELAETTAKFQNASFVPGVSMPPVNGENEIACNACHREHKGSKDLKAMTDTQCQSCHQSSFHSFEYGHPEFTNWPKSSKQNIAFDHSTHMSKHFAASGATFDCNRCHVDDPWQNAKVLAPYAQACASCHEQKIVDSSVDGFAVLSLPMLDMKAIEAQKLKVGSWPLAATGSFDGPIPPAMRILLAADPDAGPVLASKPASFEFGDLDPAISDDVQDAVTLAWSIKRLLHELSFKGTPAIKRRLQIVLGREISDSEIENMFSGLDNHAFAAVSRRWFVRLGPEIESKFGGLIEMGAINGLPKDALLAKVPVQEELAANPLAALLEGGEVSDSVGVSEPALELSLPDDSSNSSNRPALSQPRTSAVVVGEMPVGTVNRSTDDSRSGWVRDDRRLRFFYRPSGHEDQFLQHWISAVLQTPDVEANLITKNLFDALTESTSIGNCRYCHTLKQHDDSGLVMNWHGATRDGSIGQFTSFSHRPHLVQPDLQDCTHCHQLDLNVSNSDSFASLDRVDYQSNFHPIQKSNCTSCHQKGLTESSCTMCHDYHVGAHKSQ
jgi:hypothetical protein